MPNTDSRDQPNKSTPLPRLVIPRDKAADQLRKQRDALDYIFRDTPTTIPEFLVRKQDFHACLDYTRDLLKKQFDATDVAVEFAAGPIPKTTTTITQLTWRNYYRAYLSYRDKLESIINRVDNLYDETTKTTDTDADDDPVALVEHLATHLPALIADLATKPHGKAQSLFAVSDEYDLQVLLRGILRLFFDDVRSEEWTPSYAGSSSRMDFLLKNEHIVLEAKITRPNRADKAVGDELIIDIAKYQSHQDCRTLVCLVYDPLRKIRNPAGLENDLRNNSTEGLKVRVMVFPK